MVAFDIITGDPELAFDIEVDVAPSAALESLYGDLMPPGRLWDFVRTDVGKVLGGLALELARIEARATALLVESDPTVTLELLPEFERELDLPSTGTAEERRARVIAQLLARPRYRPVDFQTALAPLLGMDAASVPVIEISHAVAVSTGSDREIFRFFVYRNPALVGVYYLTSAQALLDKIKPSHTVGHVIESTAMIVDDPYSLCDRDLVGA